MEWADKVEILKQNKFVYIGDRYTNLQTNETYWVSELKEMTAEQIKEIIKRGKN